MKKKNRINTSKRWLTEFWLTLLTRAKDKMATAVVDVDAMHSFSMLPQSAVTNLKNEERSATWKSPQLVKECWFGGRLCPRCWWPFFFFFFFFSILIAALLNWSTLSAGCQEELNAQNWYCGGLAISHIEWIGAGYCSWITSRWFIDWPAL